MFFRETSRSVVFRLRDILWITKFHFFLWGLSVYFTLPLNSGGVSLHLMSFLNEFWRGCSFVDGVSQMTHLWHDLCQPLQWRHNGHDGVSNHQPHHCLLNRLFGWCRSKKTSKLRVTGLCAGNSTGTGEFPAQMASNAENVSIWWRHPVIPWRLRIGDAEQSFNF